MNKAILDAIGDFGFRFCGRSQQTASMDLEIRGICESVEILQFFPFTAETKRTTTIVRFRGTIWMFSKVVK